jgi:hypothetical protein
MSSSLPGIPDASKDDGALPSLVAKSALKTISAELALRPNAFTQGRPASWWPARPSANHIEDAGFPPAAVLDEGPSCVLEGREVSLTVTMPLAVDKV